MSSPSPGLIFALDIGTRSVVGLILEKQDQGYHVLDVYSVEHKERSMLDGQIHNVLAVSSTITYVKTHLERKHGTLKKVCVAAAGRSLKTKRSKVEVDILGKPIFERQSLLHLELSAVQKAQFDLANDSYSNQKVNDYCVGYSVIDYRLDGEAIGSLVDQRGETASVEVIATFLPKVVVESLISALQRSNLELEALTLEPIAAINVLIPQSMRRLNVALIDIGAGTSDIAITDYGTVTAYGMVPNAGDEITEELSDHFLLDFPDAERIKRDLSVKDKVIMQDILGMENSYPNEEVVEALQPAINHLADQITLEIIRLNGHSPKAVMLVGGGSLTPLLPEKIAERLELPKSRVAIRGIDAIKGLTFEQEYEATPELVTPIGIAIAAKESPVEYISIRVNEQTVRLFDIKKLTVGDGLLSSGVELSKLYGKPGMAIMLKLNGRVVSIPGQHGTPPVLKKNGLETELDAPLVHEDYIEVSKGQNGADATATIRDVLDEQPTLSIIFNGQQRRVAPIILKNGQQAMLSDQLNDRDEIECYPPKTVEDLASKLDLKGDLITSSPVQVYINNQSVTLHEKKATVFINGINASTSAPIKSGDKLDIISEEDQDLTLKSAIEKLYDLSYREIVVTFNNEPVRLEKEMYDCFQNREHISLYSPIKQGDRIEVTKKKIFLLSFKMYLRK
ncbi:pilus assembly protein PilM [Salipaludibacillus keqinensis]|uniref:pilus assembly protein PilM n=1 Tax=Salipaludibacillus keqinensis TaxID=2045207 RepID=UPI001E531CF5|nr:cell division FtsA domain-containing protein [Salipaludibacillus keqinensis]